MIPEGEEELKKVIQALLCSLGRRSTEKQLKKAYREQEGTNINNIIEKIYGTTYTLFQFLRYKCNDICDAYKQDGEIKIDKFSNESTQHIERMTKAKKRGINKKPAPKLNFPKTYLTCKSSHLNPQGFSKTRPKLPNHADPFYEPPPKKNPVQTEEHSPALDQKLTLGNFMGLQNYDTSTAAFGDETFGTGEPSRFPSFNGGADNLIVRNSCEFPKLSGSSKNESTAGPAKPGNSCDYSALISKLRAAAESKDIKDLKLENNTIYPVTIDEEEDDEEEESEEEDEGEEEEESVENSSVCSQQKDMQGSFTESSQSSNNTITNGVEDLNEKMKDFSFDQEENDFAAVDECADDGIIHVLPYSDPLFLMDYPDVIKDASTKVPMPEMKKMEMKMQFRAFITTTYTPSQFYFQCDDDKLHELTGMLQDFYRSIPEFALNIAISYLQIGQVVGAKLEGVWNRAEVQSINEDRIELLFLDFGVTMTRPISFIKYLPQLFAYTPKKALRGALFGVLPDMNKTQWSDSARNLYFLKVKDKHLFASIRSKDENDVFYLDIVDNILSCKTIADELIECFCGRPMPAEMRESFPHFALSKI